MKMRKIKFLPLRNSQSSKEVNSYDVTKQHTIQGGPGHYGSRKLGGREW